MNKSKHRIIIILVVVIVFVSIYGLINSVSLKNNNRIQIKVNDFIEYVDEASDNKAQVNWKYVCAIIGVLEDNNFKKIEREEIINIASMFIDEENKLKSVDDVIGELKLNKREVKRVYEYIDELENFGITPSKLKENTK